MEISHLLFDLDSTLYAPNSPITKIYSERAIALVADFFHISREDAAEKRLANLPYYSTTLEWMRHEGFTDIERYLEYVHPENEADELDVDEKLRALLASIPIPKSILTNSPREHADRVLEKLNIADQFESICDIRDCAFKGKPYESAYRTALEKCGSTIGNTLFFDDQRKYINGYTALGGNAVLVGAADNGSTSHTQGECVCEHGRIFRMPNIYALPALLQQIIDL